MRVADLALRRRVGPKLARNLRDKRPGVIEVSASIPNVDAGQDVWKLMIQLFQSHRRSFALIAAEAELGPSQLQLLLGIAPERAIPMSELATALYWDPSHVTSLVDKLEARGLLERRQCLGDRRVRLIALTSDGHDMRTALIARVFEPPPSIACLPKIDRETLGEILSRAMADRSPPERGN